MKTSNRIAPLLILIVLVLGISLYPRAGTNINSEDAVKIQNDQNKNQGFNGIIIEANPADRLLYARQTKGAYQMQPHLTELPKTTEQQDRNPVRFRKTEKRGCTSDASTESCSFINSHPGNKKPIEQ